MSRPATRGLEVVRQQERIVASPQRRIVHRRAVVVGIDAYDHRPLANAANDARAVARSLRDDFGFELVPDGAPLLDSAATRHALRTSIANGLAVATGEVGWLFYFAGHGDLRGGRGHLVPHGGSTGDTKGLLPLEDLVRASLDSRCGEVLLVLDACYSGSALVEPKTPWIEDVEESRGAVQMLVAGGPRQTVVDGGGGQHSVFTSALLEVLDGWAGVHERSGEIRFQPLAQYVAERVEERLGLVAGDDRQRAFGVTLRPGPLGEDFTLVATVPRLPPGLIEHLRHREPAVVSQALGELVDRCNEEHRHLPLALRLTRQAVEGDLARKRPGAQQEAVRRDDWRIRAAAARTLGKLLPLADGESGDLAGRSLLSAALDDEDRSVRHAARRALSRGLSEHRQRTLLTTQGLLGPGDRKLDARVLFALCELATARRSDPSLRLLAPLLRTTAFFTAMCRWVWRNRVPRRAMLSILGAVALLYVLLASTVYFSPGSHRSVVVRLGRPGFEALPGIGMSLADTGANLDRISDRSRVEDEQIVFPWWRFENGAIAGTARLAELLPNETAVLMLWRFGDRAGAIERLRDAFAGGDESAPGIAAYLALQDASTGEEMRRILVTALDSPPAMKTAVFDALSLLADTAPDLAADWTRSCIDEMSQDEESAFGCLEAAVALTERDEEEAARVVPFLLDRLRGEQGGEADRPVELLRRLFERRSELAAEQLEEVLLLAIVEPRFDPLLETLLGVSLDAEQGAELVDLLTTRLEGQEEGRAGNLPLLVVAAGRWPEAVVSSGVEDQLAPFVETAQGRDLLALAALAAALPEPPAWRQRMADRLAALALADENAELRIAALRWLGTLSDRRGATELARLVHDLPIDVDPGVRGAGLDALVELALDGRLPVATVEPLLSGELRSPIPRLRQNAMEGVVLLADRITSKALVGEASRELVELLLVDRLGTAQGALFARRFEATTPEAAAIFLVHALRRGLIGDVPHSASEAFELSRIVCLTQPHALELAVPDLPSALPPEGAIVDAVCLRRLLSELGKAGLDLGPTRRALEGLSEADDVAARSLAARLLGATIAGADEPERWLALLGGLMADADAEVEVAADVPGSLFWAVHGDRRYASGGIDLLIAALADRRLPVRRAAVEWMGELLRAIPDLLVPPPEASLLDLLNDPDPERQRDAGKLIARWVSAHHPADLVLMEGLLPLGSDGQPLALRLNVVPALAVLAGQRTKVRELVVATTRAGLESSDAALVESALLTVRVIGEVAPSHRVSAISWIDEVWPRLDERHRFVAISTICDLGLTDPAAARQALALLGERLAALGGEVDGAADRERRNLIVNGIGPVVAVHPELAGSGLAILDRLAVELRSRRNVDDLLGRSLSQQTADLLFLRSRDGTSSLQRRIGSNDGFKRSTAAAAVRLIAVRQPNRRDELRWLLDPMSRSLFPNRRIEAAWGREALGLLDRLDVCAEGERSLDDCQEAFGRLPVSPLDAPTLEIW